GSVRQSAGKLTRARRCTGSRSSRTSSEASSPTPTCATSPPDHSPPTYDLISKSGCEFSSMALCRTPLEGKTSHKLSLVVVETLRALNGDSHLLGLVSQSSAFLCNTE